MYECVICLSINHGSHLHCSICGAVPAKYSLSGKTASLQSDHYTMIEIVVAYGAERCASHHAKRASGFKTVTATYYAETE